MSERNVEYCNVRNKRGVTLPSFAGRDGWQIDRGAWSPRSPHCRGFGGASAPPFGGLGGAERPQISEETLIYLQSMEPKGPSKTIQNHLLQSPKCKNIIQIGTPLRMHFFSSYQIEAEFRKLTSQEGKQRGRSEGRARYFADRSGGLESPFPSLERICGGIRPRIRRFGGRRAPPKSQNKPDCIAGA